MVLSDYDPKHKVRNKDEIRVIYTIGIYTGQRLKDCVLLQWQNIDMQKAFAPSASLQKKSKDVLLI